MATRGEGRWVDDVHYYDYRPDTLRRDPTRIDSYIVAEAFIYDASETERMAIAVLVTGLELEIDKLPRDEVIRRGETIREQAIAKHRARLPAGHRAVVYDLRGQAIETKEEAR
jgi:hypothetical protein